MFEHLTTDQKDLLLFLKSKILLKLDYNILEQYLGEDLIQDFLQSSDVAKLSKTIERMVANTDKFSYHMYSETVTLLVILQFAFTAAVMWDQDTNTPDSVKGALAYLQKEDPDPLLQLLHSGLSISEAKTLLKAVNK